jgi:integrase
MSLKGKNVRVRGEWWHYQFEARGRQYSGSTGLAGCEQNQSAAEAYAERLRQEILHPAPQLIASEDPARKGFAMAAEQFLTWARDVEYRSKPGTSQRLKVSMASCKVFFGDRRVREIGAGDLEAYKTWRIQEHGVRDITLRHDLHMLSVFFRYAMKMQWAEINPVKLVTIPSDRDAVREHVVSADEEERYLAAALRLHAKYVESRSKESRGRVLPNMHDLAVLMVEQGARPEELLAVRIEDVNLQAGTLEIRGGKTRAARRTLDLTERSREVLAKRVALGGSVWLFPSDRHPGHHVTKLQGTHDRVCLEAGVSFVIYDLRHTFATRAIAAGIDAPTVAAIMGHSGLRTIYRYVHPTAEAKRSAMAKFEAANRRAMLKVVG